MKIKQRLRNLADGWMPWILLGGAAGTALFWP